MILLLGSTGYVGNRMLQYLKSQGVEVYGLSRNQIDYTTRGGLKQALSEYRPEFLVNAAGYTGKPNVDAAELDKANCLLGNAILPGLMREECEAAGIPWGHVSSGCIFSGRRQDGQGFTEEDAPNFSFRQNNCSFYSGTKALGEEAIGYRESSDGTKWVHESQPSGYVWRLRIPFDHLDSPRNFLTKLMRYDRLLVAENSISNLDDFIYGCWATWEKRVPFGIYNVTNPGHIDTRQVVDMIQASKLGQLLASSGKHFSFFENEDEFMLKAAKTPRSNTVLNSSKLASAGISLRPVEKAIEEALQNWVPEHS